MSSPISEPQFARDQFTQGVQEATMLVASLMSHEQRSGERLQAVQRVLREQEQLVGQLGLGPDVQAQVRDALSKAGDALGTASNASDPAAAAAIQTASNLLSFTLTALDTSGPPSRPPEPAYGWATHMKPATDP